MGNYRLNNDKFEVYKNPPRPISTVFDERFITFNKVVRQFLEESPYDQDQQGVYFQVVYQYENIPPKTSRIDFRKNILSVNHVPQKDIKVEILKKDVKEYKTTLTYKISADELATFKSSLESIKGRKINIESDFALLDTEQRKLIRKLSFISHFQKIKCKDKVLGLELVKFYKMYEDMNEFLLSIGVKKKVDETLLTAYLLPDEYATINEKCPWIISSVGQVGLFSIRMPQHLTKEIGFELKERVKAVKDLPIVGVIDSANTLGGNFKSYILKNEKRVNNKDAISDSEHGNMVASLIIAHDELNKTTKDYLGNFIIKHFEVLSKDSPKSDAATINFDDLKSVLEQIVKDNPEIKVWNLSFGVPKEPWTPTISYLGILLDRLSQKYDCLFVIASGNEGQELHEKSLAAPGDSLNALTVGSVEINSRGKPRRADYSSYGAILHFWKPEISHFGGPRNYDSSPLIVHNGKSTVSGDTVAGTSFAAPRVSRIAAYLIHSGYSVLETKAFIIGYAERQTPSSQSSSFGHIIGATGPFFQKLLTLHTTIKITDKKPLYLDLDLENVDQIVLSSSNYANPIPSLGEEYSISNAEIGLVQYDPNFASHTFKDARGEHQVKTPEQVMKKLVPYKNSKSGKYEKECNLRYNRGKYFTSKKFHYNLKNEKNILKKDWRYALRVRKQNLFDIKEENLPALELGIILNLHGKKLNEAEFIKRNESIIEVYAEPAILVKT
ncbi:S8 family peptidase [Mycoplasma sp. ATU-Cv-703]|uniref:S8 family serine peptidase n=1 Tax=Mycoplasma sp. ATU-Cv-703 TaxID=2498595 RepID=UPI000FDED3A8